MNWKTITQQKLAVELPNFSDESIRSYKGEQGLYGIWQQNLSEEDFNAKKLHPQLLLGDLDGARRYLGAIEDQDWFRKSFALSGPSDRIKLHHWNEFFPDQQRPRSTASTHFDQRRNPFILLTDPLDYSASRLVLLHEIAHATDTHNILKTPRNPTLEMHGPSFRGNYLHIVHHAIGEYGSEALMMGYRQQGLTWNFDSIRPGAKIDALRYKE